MHVVAIASTIAATSFPAASDQCENAYHEDPFGAAVLQECTAQADAGNAEAQHAVGFVFAHGKSNLLDPVKAAKWFEKAARQGHAPSQWRLGIAYRIGNGVRVDYRKAIELFVAASVGGEPRANLGIARMYMDGRGVPQSYPNAEKWIKKSVERADPSAMKLLADLYRRKRRSVPALTWYERAAEATAPYALDRPSPGFVDSTTFSSAAYSLGEMYENGEGGPRDHAQAHMWYSLAALGGWVEATERREELAGKMTPEQISEAQSLAVDWWNRYRTNH